MVMRVNGGTYKSRIEANEVCRRMRHELKGEFDIPAVSWRRHFLTER
jgi:hypothetical protein